jgi:hypothetical protein
MAMVMAGTEMETDGMAMVAGEVQMEVARRQILPITIAGLQMLAPATLRLTVEVSFKRV